jgi:hypothetical protein
MSAAGVECSTRGAAPIAGTECAGEDLTWLFFVMAWAEIRCTISLSKLQAPRQDTLPVPSERQFAAGGWSYV